MKYKIGTIIEWDFYHDKRKIIVRAMKKISNGKNKKTEKLMFHCENINIYSGTPEPIKEKLKFFDITEEKLDELVKQNNAICR